MGRNYVTEQYYPDKVPFSDFVMAVITGLGPFYMNMDRLKATEYKYVEEWMDLFTRWMELNKGE